MYNITEMFKKTEWTEKGPVTIYTFEFDFKNKEEYLEQTAGWKAEYKELSKRIRQYKLWRKPSLCPPDVSVWKLFGFQEQARQMCQMRVQAKQQAYRQMMAERQAA